jgi:hypothetical protein
MTKPEPLNPAQLQELVQAIKEAEAELAEYEYPWGRDRLRERKDEYTEYCLTHASDIAALGEHAVKFREANGILEDALQEVGDDYPGSSCQEWCRQQVKLARQALGDTP